MSCCRETNDLNKVLNYLLLGNESNFYQAGKKSVNFGERLSFVEKLIRDGRGVEVVKAISDFQVEEEATEFQEVRIYALVHCTRCDQLETKRAAYEALSLVCPTARHLLVYVCFSEQVGADKRSSGWGRAQRKALAKWYNDRPALELAKTCARFTNYRGWTHRDVLRLAHIKPKSKSTSAVLTYTSKGLDAMLKVFENDEEADEIVKYLKSIHSLQQTKDEKEAAFLVEQKQLHLEMIPTNMRKSTEVWRSLLPLFPLSKLVFHIRRFAQLGFLNSNNPVYPILLDQLKDHSRLSPTDLHPVDIFLALKKYEDLARATSNPGAAPRSHPLTGGGIGVNTFRPPKRRLNTAVVDALHNMFTASLQKCAVPLRKRILVTVDVRNPMVHSKVQGCPQMTPALASAILVLSLLNSDEGELVTITAFSSNDIKVLELTKDMSLLEIAKRMRETPMGPVNAAKPLTWAKQNSKSYDAFLIFTDNQVKPADGKLGEHLSQYRSALNIPNVRLFLCSLAARRLTTALPEQSGVIEIAGFDAHVPRIFTHFIRASIW